jgi:uncharacterized protein YbjT (DUF2867 family)
MPAPLGVTGSTGQLGGRIARLLAAAGAEQRLVVRTPARAPLLWARRSPRRRTSTGTPYDGRSTASTSC